MNVSLTALWGKYKVPTSTVSIPPVGTGYDNRRNPWYKTRWCPQHVWTSFVHQNPCPWKISNYCCKLIQPTQRLEVDAAKHVRYKL